MPEWDKMSRKERNKYINQDQVGMREFVGPSPTFISESEEVDWYECNKPESRIVYEMYILDRRSIDDILFHIKLEKSEVEYVLDKLRNNFKNKENSRVRRILEAHFVHRKKVTKIARQEQVMHSYVSKIINKYLEENLKELKNYASRKYYNKRQT
jgi:PP-loop superfamily ATP-utilizing enzyme